MKNKLKKILSLFICVLIVSGTMICADAATTATVVSSSPSSNVDILHMDRTVTATAADGTSKEGFDVTVTAYVDELSKITTPVDIMFVADSSNSMSNSERGVVIDSIKKIVNAVKANNNTTAHRFGLVSFNRGVQKSATLDRLYSMSEVNFSSGDWADAFSSFKFNLGEDGGTQIYAGLEKAKNILKNNQVNGRTQMLILFTDGLPTGKHLVDFLVYTDYAGADTLEQARQLKENGVRIYTVKTFYDWATTDTHKNRATRLCKYISSAYGTNATDVDNTSYEPVHNEFDYIHSANDIAALIRSIGKSIYTTAIYPFVLSSDAITQDVVSPYFTPSNAKCVIQKANYSNGNILSWSNASDYNSITAQISGQRVYATGFDYINRAVSETNSNPSRLVLSYHIDPIPNFFGGNSVPTNIVGTRENDDPLTGGSGIYCPGPDNDFLKPFENIPVNVIIKSRTMTAQSTVNVSYGTNIDVDNYYNFNDLTTGSNLLNGINNAFVDVTFSVSPSFDSAGGSSAWKGNGKFTTDENDSKKQNFVVKAGEDYSEGVLDWFNSYAATSESGDTIKFSYSVDSAKAYAQNSVGNSVTSKTASKTVKINAVSTYKVVFKYADGTPASVTALPAEQTGSSESWAQSVVQTVEPKAGSSSNVSGVNYAFLGWGSPTISRSGAVVTYTYTGSWKASDAGFTVNVYVMNTDAKDTSDSSYTLQGSYFLSGAVGNTVNRTECDAFDEASYFFFRDCDKTVLTKDSFTHSKDGDKYAASFKAASLVSGSDAVLIDDEQAIPGTYRCDAYLCSNCGGVVEEGNLINNTDGTFSTNCPRCKKLHDVMRYSDFSINDDKSTRSITISANTADNKMNIYVDRVPHTIDVSLSYDDAPEKNSSFSITAPYGASISETINNLSQEQKDAYMAFAYLEDGVTPVEETPYYDCDGISFPYFRKGSSGIRFVKKSSFQTYNWTYVSDLFEKGDVLSDVIQPYDIVSELNLTKIKYDVVVTKKWDESAGQKNKQNCVFGLYELDNEGNYKLLMKFVIGVDETSKTIKSLIAGKTYVIEEEEWSYKTVSDWKRGGEGANKFNNSSYNKLTLTCTNRTNSDWVYAPAVDKGVRNQLSNGEIVAEPIKKTMVGGEK